MKKIAVFGPPGGGKSTLSKVVARQLDLPLIPLDQVQYLEGGAKIPDDQFLATHSHLLATHEAWVIDGLGTMESFRIRLEAADTLIYVHRSAWVHYWWVAKRFFESPIKPPEGWPAASPMLRSTLQSWYYLGLSKLFWNERFENHLNELASTKQVFFVRNDADVGVLLHQLSK